MNTNYVYIGGNIQYYKMEGVREAQSWELREDRLHFLLSLSASGHLWAQEFGHAAR